MRIAIVTAERLQEFPPMITLLKAMDQLGHETVLLSPYHDPFFAGLGMKHGAHLFAAEAPDARLTRYYRNRIQASLAFHTERMLRRKHLRSMPRRFSEELRQADVIWVLHENTMLLGGKRFADRMGEYLYTMYELCVKNSRVPEVYDYAAGKAGLTVVPEYTRAHIAKAFYSLEQLPAVIPNKPLEHPRMKNMPISDNAIREKIRRIRAEGKKIIMYMGILSDERPLEPIIEAVNTTDHYVLAVLGGRTPYLDRLEQKMGGRFEYLGEVKPPYHLEVASHADVAYISYVARNGSINAVFCAPNKVYEFAGFGIPMLCNDNPGLKFTVEHQGMGVCVPELSVEAIRAALERIDASREAMGEAANRYYDAESVEKAVSGTLERYMKIKEGKRR